MRVDLDPGFRDVASYFAAVILLTVPFWIASSFVHVTPLPGLSIAAFAVVVPAISAFIVAATVGGRAAVASLAGAILRPARRPFRTATAASALPVAISLFSWSISKPSTGAPVAPLDLLVLLPVFLLAAAAEEIGWSSYATEHLLSRTSTIAAGLLVGIAWALWHIPSLVDIGRSASWITWWSVWTVAQRILMTQIYLRGGMWIGGPILFHTASNIAWQAAPGAFDPQIQGTAMAMIALGAVFAAHSTDASASRSQPWSRRREGELPLPPADYGQERVWRHVMINPQPGMAEIMSAVTLLQVGSRAEARQQLLRLWTEWAHLDAPLQRCIIAHFLADTEEEPFSELEWDLQSLEAATGGRNGEDRDTVSPDLAAFLPSLHLNVGDCYRRLGDQPRAWAHAQIGLNRTNALPEDAYGGTVRSGLRRLYSRLQCDWLLS